MKLETGTVLLEHCMDVLSFHLTNEMKPASPLCVFYHDLTSNIFGPPKTEFIKATHDKIFLEMFNEMYEVVNGMGLG